MKIYQIYTHNQLRNFTYILELNDCSAIVIDPWDEQVISSALDEKKLSLKAIINTHEHWDHTQGNNALVEKYQCEVWAHENGKGKIPGLTDCLKADQIIPLDQEHQLRVLDTPGHTFAHLCFIVEKNNQPLAVFTGDTLFNAGVGHCRGGGDEEVLYKTISEQFQTLEDNIIVYPGHDYLENNLRFTLKFEPSNDKAKEWLIKVESDNYQPGSLQTNIGDEKNFNTFMRLDNSEIISNLAIKNISPKNVFMTLRAHRDKW